MKKFLRVLSLVMVFALFVQIMPMSVIAQAVASFDSSSGVSVEGDVLRERKDLRDRYTKVFERVDGTYTAVVSASPLHHMENEAWQDIDNTLDEATIGESPVLKNKSNDFTVTLPKSMGEAGEGVKLEKDGFTLEYKLNDINPPFLKKNIKATQDKIKLEKGLSEAQKAVALERKTAIVKYAAIQPDIDLEYTVLPDSVKEDIVLNKKPKGDLSFSFTIRAENMTAKHLPDNTIEFYGVAETPIFTLPAPFMVDANNAVSEDILVAFEKNASSYTLTYSPSTRWLMEKERVYPVAVDPVVKITPSTGSIFDSFVSNVPGKQTVNHGSYTYATVGNEEEGSYWAYFRPYSVWASKAVITEATLSVYAKSDTANQVMPITAKTVTSNWFSSVTYNNRPTNDSTAIDYAVAPANTFEQISFDITQALPRNQDHLNGAVYPHGVMLEAYDTALNTATIITSEYATAQYRPVIEYTYFETTGKKEAFEYSSHSAGRAGQISVNDFTGGMYIERDELGIDGNIMPVHIKQYYSTATVDVLTACDAFYWVEEYGLSWLTNYHRFLARSEGVYVDENGNPENLYLYVDGMGGVTYFAETDIEDGDYTKWIEKDVSTALPGGLELWVHSSGTMDTACVVEPSGQKLSFDSAWVSAGRMISITAAENEHITGPLPEVQIVYSTGSNAKFYTIEKIIDGVGREFRFTYNTLGRLMAIQAFDAQNNAIKVGPDNSDLKMTYTYVGNGSLWDIGKLETATYPDGEMVSYSYISSAGAPVIESVTDINGYRLAYTYNSKFEVTQITESALDAASTRVTGNVIDIQYDSPYQRTIEDAFGRKEIKQYDRYGRKTGAYNEEGHYQRTTYEDTLIDDKLYNLFAGQTYIQEQEENLLSNPGFENGSTNWTIPSVATVNNAVMRTGNNSLKFDCTASPGNNYAFQNITNLTPGRYTFSAYLYLPEAISGTDGAKIRMTTKDSADSIVETRDSEFVRNTGELWQRLSISIDVSASTPTLLVYIDLHDAAAVAYFDDVKLECSDLETPYNVLSNSKMSAVTNGMPNNWTGTNLTSSDGAATQVKFDDSVNVVKITGNPNTQKSVSQTVSVSGGPNDTIEVGCWAKAATVINGGNATFRLRIEYYNQTLSQTEVEIINLVPYADYWQYVADSIVLKGSCSEITLYLDYDNQIHTAYFTDVRLVFTDNAFGGAGSQGVLPEHDPDNLLLNPGFESGDADWTLPNEASIVTETEKVRTGTHAHELTCATAGNHYSSQTIEELVPSKYSFTMFVFIPQGISGVDAGAKLQVITKDTSGTPVDTYNSNFIKTTNAAWQELRVNFETTTAAPNVDLRICLTNAASTAYYDDGRVEYLRYEYSYDSMGNLLSTTVNNTVSTMVTTNTYTSDKNYLASTTNSAGNMIQYSYNTGNGTLTSLTDGEQNSVGYTYNAMRALAGVAQTVSNLSSGAALTNNYEYENDRLTDISAANTVEYSFEYDLWGNQTSVKVGTQPLAQYTYGTGKNYGRTESVAFGNGQTITFSYDSYNNVTGISYDEGTTWSYTYVYSSTNGLVSASDHVSNQITYFTDAGYEIYTLVQTGQGDLLYSSSYDEDDNFVQTANGYTYTFADGAAETEAEAAIRRTTGLTVKRSTISSAGTSLALSSSKDFFGRPVNNTFGVKDGANDLGSVAVEYTYQGGTGNQTTEFVSSYKNVVTPTTGSATNVEYTYTYDANGNISSDSLGGVLKHSYVYDEAGQLVRVNDAVQNRTFCYAYDNGGNLTSKKRYAYTTGDTLGSVQKTWVYAYGDSNWKDNLTSYDNKSLVYDAIGNLTSYNYEQFTWTAGRQLEKHENIAYGTIVEYKYNADGLRTQKIVEDEFYNYYVVYDYIWADGKLVSQTDGTDTLYFLFDDNDRPFGFVLNDAATYLYIKNLQGDITGIANENGTIIVNYTYDEWGKPISTTGSGAGTIGAQNPLRYRGYYYDEETEYYYLQSRYYNPTWGRFINADDVKYIYGLNLYFYCSNNPVNNTDYNGHFDQAMMTRISDDNYRHNSTYSISGYINGQSVHNCSTMRYGVRTLRDNGCGPIAMYNATLLLSKSVQLKDVIRYSEKNGGLWWDGIFGAKPESIPLYLLSVGIKTKNYYLTKSIDRDRKPGDIYILCYAHSRGGHYIAVKSLSNGTIDVYNRYSNRSTKDNISSVQTLIKNDGFKLIVGYYCYRA